MDFLREYQKQAVIKIRNSILAGNTNPLFVLSTGAGKSHIFGDIIRRAHQKNKRVLWIVHRRNLVLQFQETLKEYFGIDSGIIMSGVETDVKRHVQLCTVQTMARRIKLGPKETNKFIVDADMVMIDEGHHVISPSYEKILNHYKDKIIIGCTATPTRLDNRPLNKVYNDIVEVVGIKQLTKQGYLSPTRYFIPTTIDTSGIKVVGGDYHQGQLAKKANTKQVLGDVVENWLKFGEDRKTLIFAVDVKHSIYLRDEFINAGVTAEHLDARSKDHERELVFQRMETGMTKVITNVMLYNEGMDAPGISCVIIVRPTKSLGLYRQMVGRGLRIYDGKKDCLVFDHGGNIERHGFVEDELLWTLAGNEKAFKKPKSKEPDVNPVTCVVCHEVFLGLKKCPICGTEVKTVGKKIEVVDAELKELKKNNREMTWDDKARVMGAVLWHAEQKGYNPNWAKHAYRDFFNVWPNDKRVKYMYPLHPEGKIKNILTHILIKKAKQYQKVKNENNKVGHRAMA